MQRLPLQLRTVQVLHGGALGDCVLALHLCRMMHQSWGEPKIAFVGRSSIAELARQLGWLASFLHSETGFAALRFRESALSAAHPDGPVDETHAVVSFVGAPAFPNPPRKLLLVDPRPLPGSPLHITDQWARQLCDQGRPVRSGHHPQVEIDAGLRCDWSADLRARVGNGRGRMAILHPGSGGTRKCCPLEPLEVLVDCLRARGWSPVWMIGPDEVERDGPKLRDRLASSALVLFEESVVQAAKLAGGADLYVGQDAGMTHVAAWMGVRTLAMFGPTDPNVWRPLGRHVRIIDFPPHDDPGRSLWIRNVVESLAS